MRIDVQQIISVISMIFAYFYSKKTIWEEVVKIVTPLITLSEEMALDGIIDKSERKQLVLEAVKILESEGKIKINWIMRLVINWAIESIVKRLPDFKVVQASDAVMRQAKKELLK